ncbi:MAG: hypothetical protein ACRDAM_22260, partial [Casimicrobium sp.]
MSALTKVSVEVPLAIGRALDYVAPAVWDVAVGMAVEVTVGARPHIALVTRVEAVDIENNKPTATPLKEVRRIVSAALPEELVALAEFLSNYYQVSRGVAFGLITPNDTPPAATPIAGRLPPLGEQATALLTVRQTKARELRALLKDILKAEQRSALSPNQRRTLGEWIEKAWVEAIFEQSQDTLVFPQFPKFTHEQS